MTPSFGLSRPGPVRAPRRMVWEAGSISRAAACGYPRLAAEAKQQNVPVLHHVFLALGPCQPLLPGPFPAAHPHEIVIRDRLRANEPFLEIRVDHPCCRRRLVTLVNRPGPPLLLSGREAAPKPEQGVSGVGQPVEPGFADAEGGEKLDPVLGCQLG